MAEKSTALQLMDLREKASKEKMSPEELITKHYEIVKQLADDDREDEAFQLYNSTMQLEASLTNRKTAEVMGETALHFRDTERVFGEDIGDFQKGVGELGRYVANLASTGESILTASGEMVSSASKIASAAAQIENAAFNIKSSR